jgi:hypothetical protein
LKSLWNDVECVALCEGHHFVAPALGSSLHFRDPDCALLEFISHLQQPRLPADT